VILCVIFGVILDLLLYVILDVIHP
jgi:hypothetical protein